jgi:hypothetical protein
MKRLFIVEQAFSWIKDAGRVPQTELRGTEKVGWDFTLHFTAFNLRRMANLPK